MFETELLDQQEFYPQTEFNEIERQLGLIDFLAEGRSAIRDWKAQTFTGCVTCFRGIPL